MLVDDKQARERVAADDLRWLIEHCNDRPKLSNQRLEEIASLVESLSAQVAAQREEEDRLEHTLALVRMDRDHHYERAEAAEAQVAELKKDAERLDWLDRVMFEGKLDGTIGRPKSWSMAGPYRHELVKMRGASLREAIDAAKESGVSP